MYTRKQLEAGEGLYADRSTTILQREDEDNFDTAPRGDAGWSCRPLWHIAGWATQAGKIEWVDLWSSSK